MEVNGWLKYVSSLRYLSLFSATTTHKHKCQYDYGKKRAHSDGMILNDTFFSYI